MPKGGKRYSSMENDGKWFAHAGLNETSKWEACTSTGSMLAMRETLSLAPDTERYPKTFLKTNQKISERVYPFSACDNRYALQDTINAFDDGLGRKKCLDERRQHNSHLCLCHEGGDVIGAQGTTLDFSANQTTDSQDRGGATCRRFPKNHLDRSKAAAAAQAGQHFLWFGRHDSDHTVPLGVLAATNHSSPSKPPQLL